MEKRLIQDNSHLESDKPPKKKRGRPRGSKNKSDLQIQLSTRKNPGQPIPELLQRQIVRLHLMGFSRSEISKKIPCDRTLVMNTINDSNNNGMKKQIALTLDFDLHKKISHAFSSYHSNMDNIIFKGLDIMSGMMDQIYAKVDEGKKLTQSDYTWIIRAVEKILPMMEKLASFQEKSKSNDKHIKLKEKEIDLKYDPSNRQNEAAEQIIEGIESFIKSAKGEVVEAEFTEEG